MSLVSPELLLQSLIQAQQQNLMANYAAYSQSIYGNLPTDFQQDAADWWAAKGTSLTIQQGYAWMPQQLPLVSIVHGEGQEVESDQPIGEMLGSVYTPGTESDYFLAGDFPADFAQPPSYDEYHGTVFRTQFRFHVLTANANLTIYLALFVKWVLLSQRAYLSQPEQGLIRQLLSISDLTPDPEAMRTDSVPVYERVVTLTASHYDSYIVPGTAITGVQMNLTPIE